MPSISKVLSCSINHVLTRLFTEQSPRSKQRHFLCWINELFLEYSSGIQTKKDEIVVQFTKTEMDAVIEDFNTLDRFV